MEAGGGGGVKCFEIPTQTQSVTLYRGDDSVPHEQHSRERPNACGTYFN